MDFKNPKNEEKFPTGPIISPKPVPIFPRQESGAVIVVIKSRFSNEINITKPNNIAYLK